MSLSSMGRRDPIRLHGLRVEHDLYYLGPHEQPVAAFPNRDKSLTTGPDQYFMLGDNTGSSSDSRVWTAYVERLKDGTEARWDSGNSEDTHFTTNFFDGKAHYSVTDIEGVHRAWTEDDIVRSDGGGRRSGEDDVVPDGARDGAARRRQSALPRPRRHAHADLPARAAGDRVPAAGAERVPQDDRRGEHPRDPRDARADASRADGAPR